MRIDVDEIEQRLHRPDYWPVLQSLHGIGIGSPLDLFATYAGQKADLGRWFQGAEINHDNDLRLQYLAGWGINSNLADAIYREMLRYRQVPENLFAGSPERVQTLRYSMGAQ